MEEWRDVVGFEGIYVVSSLGRIMRVAKGNGTRPGHIRKVFTNRLGYQTLVLSKNDKSCPRSVHRLVAEAFLGPCPDGYEVNHKNGCPSDNRVENLEWVTESENQYHSYRELGRIAPHGMSHHEGRLSDDDVRDIRSRVAAGESQHAMAREYNVSQPMISGIIHRVYWKHL